MIQAKGRNGFFVVGNSGICTFPPVDGKVEVYVYIESKRAGKSSPITLTGPREEVKELLQNLLTRIKEDEGD